MQYNKGCKMADQQAICGVYICMYIHICIYFPECFEKQYNELRVLIHSVNYFIPIVLSGTASHLSLQILL